MTRKEKQTANVIAAQASFLKHYDLDKGNRKEAVEFAALACNGSALAMERLNYSCPPTAFPEKYTK